MKKICKNCKKEFNGKKIQTCCSRKCSNELRFPKIKLKCDYCGKDIEKIKSKVDRHNFHYCDNNCRSQHQKEILKGSNNPNYKGKSFKINCDYCGIEFISNDYYKRENNYRYCSYDCKSQHQKEILKGENNPNYGNRGENNPLWNPNRTDEERIGVRNIYGYKEFVINVLERDNYTCQCCGDKIHGNGVVHHLDGYNWCKEKRTDINNGATLCEDCHKEFHNIYGKGNNTKEQFDEFMVFKVYEIYLQQLNNKKTKSA